MQFHNALLENKVRSVLIVYPEEGHGVRKSPAAIGPRAVPTPPPAEEEPDGDDDKPTGGAEVVRLDRFRKK